MELEGRQRVNGAIELMNRIEVVREEVREEEEEDAEGVNYNSEDLTDSMSSLYESDVSSL